MQTLKIYQSLWAMERRQPGVAERPMEDNYHIIREAGFDGICLDPSVAEIESYAGTAALCEKYELACMLNAFPYQIEDMQPLLKFAISLQATLVNIIGGVMPVNVNDAIPVIHRWQADADKAGIPALFETHRDSLLNDLFYTIQLLDLVPELRLCADLSHFVIDREMRLPLSSRDASFMHQVLQRSDCFQGRVATREQIQVPINFPQHQAWVEQFKAWWKAGMLMWRQRNPPDACLIFLCELGPPPYAITDANQLELSDRFSEAVQIKKWVEDIWAETAVESVAGA